MIRLPAVLRWPRQFRFGFPTRKRSGTPLCSGLPRGLPSSRCLSAYIPRPMKTPAAPPESRPRPMPRQALQGTLRFPCFGFRHSETVADRIIIIDEAALDFGECGLPCGLHASLCTLRMFCSAIDHSGSIPPPHTQHSVRVVGYSLPDGDLHPTRSIELLGAPDLLISGKIQ